MVALSYLSAIHFSDANAGDFLQSQLSADVLALAEGESTFACYCEPKGRVLALLLVCRGSDGYYVVVSSSLAKQVVDRMRIYVMRSKVNIEILDNMALSGTRSDDTPDLPRTSVPPIPLPGGKQWFVLTERDATDETTVSLQDAWKTSELKRGITWLDSETSGEFLPQMLGFDQLGAVNFRKGCYPGQEIVARTHYLGKVKRHPRVLCTKITLHPDPLEKIHIFSGGKSYGAVVADCAQGASGSCVFVVTRMDPELTADEIAFRDQNIPLA